MKVFIYYFTGTGNSLLVARKITERLDGAVLRPITEMYGSGTDNVSADDTLSNAHAIGFVFPVYFDRIPEMVRNAIEKSQFSEAQYFFAAVTNGGQAGNTFVELDSVLRSRGVRLDYGKAVDMADNSIIIRTSEAKAAIRLARTDEVADEIAGAVINCIKMEHAFKQNHFASIMGNVNKFAVMNYYKAERRKVDVTRCSHCGMCVNICPARNISMEERGVIIGDNCKWCFACLNWCPKSAIVFGRIDPLKRQQYRCPGISAADIARKSGK